MLYLIHGTDTQKSLEKSKKLVKTMLAKKPNASHFRINSDNFDINELQEFIGGQGLFENKYIVQISRVLDETEIKATVLDFAEQMRKSENIFIWTESEIDAKTLKILEKNSEKVEENNLRELKEKRDNRNFELGNAIGMRDKKKAWILYNELVEEKSAEEIHGSIFWQIKSMLLALKSGTAKESGLNPFVYSKSKTFTKNFKEEEIENLSSKLISISHDAHRGKHDFKIAIERFILEM